MEALIMNLIAALAPLATDAIRAKEANDEARHAEIVKTFNEKVMAAYAEVNGLGADLDVADAKFHDELRALAQRLGQKKVG